LLGVSAERGTLSDKSYLEGVLSALSSRLFLMHDVHRGKPVLMQSRQALSFLRGPMSREQVALLMAGIKGQTAAAVGSPLPGATVAIPLCHTCKAELTPGMKFCPACGELAPGAVAANPHDSGFKAELRTGAMHASQSPAAPVVAEPPALPSEISQYYLPVSVQRPPGAQRLLYQAKLYGAAEVAFVDKKKGKEYRRPYRLLLDQAPDAGALRWAAGERATELPSSGSAEPGAHWGDVPASLDTARKMKGLEKSFADHLYANARMTLLQNGTLGLSGEPGEDVVTFRDRCRRAAHQEADKALTALRRKYEPQFQALGVPVPEGHVREDESLLDAFNPLHWFRSAPRADTKDRVNKLHSEWLIKQADVVAQWKKAGDEYTETTLAPRRQDVQVTQFGLAWAPFWEIDSAGRPECVPAFQQA
jgi:hypothetical protein